MTNTRTRWFSLGRGTFGLLAVGATLTVAGVVGAMFEQAALLRMSTDGAYEPLKTLPVNASGGYLFPSGTLTTIDPRPLEVFIAIAILGAVVLVAGAARRTILRATPTV